MMTVPHALHALPPPRAALAQWGEVVTAGWATDASRLREDAALLDAVTLLRAAPTVRMIAIVDAQERPCGTLLERDMRPLLLNPFGHALLSNRGLSMGVADRMLPCATVEIGTAAIDALAVWRGTHDAEGLILTRHGRFAGIVDQPTLLRIVAEQAGRAHAVEQARAQRIEAAALRFRAEGQDIADGLGEVSRAVGTASRRIADRAATIDARTGDVADAAGEAAANLLRIAAGAHTFTGTLDAVEQRMHAAEAATREAVARTRSGAEQIGALAEAADAIATVSAAIDTVAQQTGMLALNAAIESARAGAAASGFSAVAGEVKTLALRTRGAAGAIADHVARIRTAIASVSDGHAGIARTVEAIEHLSASIIVAVREQGVAGREISANVDAASIAATQIDASVSDVLGRAHEAGGDAGAMRALAERLATIAAAVDTRIATFLREVDALGN